MLKRKKEFNRLILFGFSFIILGLCILIYFLSVYINDSYKELNLKKELYIEYENT